MEQVIFQGRKSEVSDKKTVSEIDENGHDEGRRATPWAHTQGKQSHTLKEASQTPPAPYRPLFRSKKRKNTDNLKNIEKQQFPVFPISHTGVGGRDVSL